MDVLASIQHEGPVGVTRLLLVTNMTHATLQELVASFDENGWAIAEKDGERVQWRITEKGTRVLEDLRRVDAVMQDHGLGL